MAHRNVNGGICHTLFDRIIPEIGKNMKNEVFWPIFGSESSRSYTAQLKFSVSASLSRHIYPVVIFCFEWKWNHAKFLRRSTSPLPRPGVLYSPQCGRDVIGFHTIVIFSTHPKNKPLKFGITRISFANRISSPDWNECSIYSQLVFWTVFILIRTDF